MTSEPPRQSPQSAVQATGQVAEGIVSGLKQQPALLAIVVMNVLMVVALFWFMNGISDAVKTNRDQLMAMISRCLNGEHHRR